MSKTILVCGHGPGISDAVAKKFGAEGFAVGLVARNAERLETAAAGLRASGVRAAALPADLGDPAAIASLVARAREALGPISVLHWNAYGGSAGDLLTASLDELRASLDVGVTGLIAAVQAALPDLRAQAGSSAVLVTGGAFAFYDPAVDAMANRFGAMGLAVSKAAQHKLVGLLADKLAADKIYVGDLVVAGVVKGTPFAGGGDGLDPNAIAARFFEMYTARSPATAVFR